jgi:hypothetical protein|tara:strand:- start:537 stop:761 length:225 start_codon:yes stop_codon:yes gene_type:complete
MGIGILDALIPARFILTMGHLVSLLTLAYTIKVCGQDCESTLSRMPGEYGKAKKEVRSLFTDETNSSLGWAYSV